MTFNLNEDFLNLTSGEQNLNIMRKLHHVMSNKILVNIRTYY